MIPVGLKFTSDHEWVRVDGDECTVGITEFAAEQLGDVTYVELPEIGTDVTKGGEAGAVESVKAASDIFAPVSGEVFEVNEALEDRPELVNESPYEEGWFFKISGFPADALGDLMDAQGYEQFLEEQEH